LGEIVFGKIDGFRNLRELGIKERQQLIKAKFLFDIDSFIRHYLPLSLLPETFTAI